MATTELRDLDWLTAGDGLDGVVELALSASSMVMWRVVLADASLSWTPGLDGVLGVAGEPDAAVADRLRTLIAPMTTAAGTATTWQDFDLEQPLDAPGATRWLQFRARILGTGPDRALVGIVTDVTERHESRQALTDLAERYRLLVDLSPDAIGVHQNGIVVYANPAALRMLGADSPDELLGRPITSIVHAESVPEMQRRLLTLAGPGAASEPAEARMVRFDGGELAVESVSVMTMWEGRPAFQVILRDITAQRAAEAALRYQAALASHVSDAIIAVAADGIVTSWNPAAEAVYGHPVAAAVGRPVSALVGAPLDPALVVRDGGVVQTTHHRPDGSALDVRVSAAEMAGGYVLVCADETARRRAEQFFTTVVASLAEGVVVVSATGQVESVNPAARRILDLGEAGTVSLSATNFILHDESGRRLPPDLLPTAVTRRTGTALHNQVVCVFRPDGNRVWLSLSCHPLPASDGGPYAVVASFTDITERRAISERLAFEATHDPLTGLANRALVTQWLTAARGRDTIVLFVDIDRFKVINDSLGHGVGDIVLRIVGKRLRRAVRGDDLVGRLGGDEFVVGVKSAQPRDARRIAENLAAALSDPVVVDGRRLHVNASIGIVVAPPDDTRSADELLRDADLAMYQAKTQGRGRHAFFDVELRERTQRRLQLDEDLRGAIGREELWVAYQPVVELPGRHMVGAEALLRWSHPAHGDVSPVEFIPLAEDSGTIHEIGTYVLRETCRTLARRTGAGGSAVHVAVNLSAVQLDDPNLTVMVRETLSSSGLPPSSLCLEITESMLMRDHVAATRQLNELRALGVRLAIDDFGTGYSSLAQLRRLPLDTLKIDRSFVSGLGGSRDAEAIVTSIIAMAHAVDLTVVAEGVETEQQLDVLQRLGCDLAQGYYFGRPARAVDVFR
jgi:diguanylate cyclase (GGDEF)-like protein/PAS domain S-box-containing protein